MTPDDPGLLNEADETTTHTEPVDDSVLDEDPRWTHRDYCGHYWYFDVDDNVWYCEDGNWAATRADVVLMRGPLTLYGQ